jgi:hypothetical protein
MEPAPERRGAPPRPTPLASGTEVKSRSALVLDGVEALDRVRGVVPFAEGPRGMGVAFDALQGYSQR